MNDAENLDTNQLSQLFTKAVQEKNYFILSGILLMILVMIFKKYILPKISKDEKYIQYIPAIAFGVSFVAAIASWILNPSLDIAELLITSVGATFVASGSYESLIKPVNKLIPKKENNIETQDFKKEEIQ